MSSDQDFTNLEANKVDVSNLHICSNLDALTTNKKTLKRKIYENRLNYGRLSQIGIVLDEVRYYPFYQNNNVQEMISKDNFYKKPDNINLLNTLVHNNDEINFSLGIRSHRRKYKLESMLEEKLNALEKINK